MFNAQTFGSATGEPVADLPAVALAADKIAAIIEAGVRTLVAEPWRVARIVRAADEMTIDELAAQMARRRRAAPPADLNRAIALAQLSRALNSPQFRAAWAKFRAPSRLSAAAL
jgi:hypothetical protein